MRPANPPRPVDWARYRTVGIDLLLVGVVVLVISSGFAFYAVCPNPGNCQIEIDWPTLSPGIVLAAAGAFLLFMARRRKKSPGT